MSCWLPLDREQAWIDIGETHLLWWFVNKLSSKAAQILGNNSYVAVKHLDGLAWMTCSSACRALEIKEWCGPTGNKMSKVCRHAKFTKILPGRWWDILPWLDILLTPGEMTPFLKFKQHSIWSSWQQNKTKNKINGLLKDKLSCSIFLVNAGPGLWQTRNWSDIFYWTRDLNKDDPNRFTLILWAQ